MKSFKTIYFIIILLFSLNSFAIKKQCHKSIPLFKYNTEFSLLNPYFEKKLLDANPTFKTAVHIDAGSEADVLKITRHNLSEFVLKQYRVDPETEEPIFDPADNNASLEALNKILKFAKSIRPDLDMFNVVQPIEVYDDSLAINFIVGRELGSILFDNNITDELRLQLFKNYKTRVNNFIYFVTAYISSDINFDISNSTKYEIDGVKYISGFYESMNVYEKNGPKVRIDFKTRNILVDPFTLDMTIIDPF